MIRELNNESREHCDQHLIRNFNIMKELSQDESTSIIKKVMTEERRNKAFSWLKHYHGKVLKSQAIN